MPRSATERSAMMTRPTAWKPMASRPYPLTLDSHFCYITIHSLLLVQHCADIHSDIHSAGNEYMHACNKCTFTLRLGIRAFSPLPICTLLERSRSRSTVPSLGTVNPTICKPPLDWSYRSFGFAQKRWRESTQLILKRCFAKWTSHIETHFSYGTSLQFHLSSAFCF